MIVAEPGANSKLAILRTRNVLPVGAISPFGVRGGRGSVPVSQNSNSTARRIALLLDRARVSGPEPILSLFIALILAKFDCLSVFDSPNVHLRERGGNPISLRVNSD